jgi:ribosomal protein L14
MSEMHDKFADFDDEEIVLDITGDLTGTRVGGLVVREVSEQQFSFNSSDELKKRAFPADWTENE